MENDNDNNKSINGTRFCSSCFTTRYVAGGVYVITKRGLGRRWKCAECVARAKERADEK
jgi:hypothetical protein